jgi:hypothetical protein
MHPQSKSGPRTFVHLPRPRTSVVFQQVPGGAVLLSTEDEVYYGLNGVGARVWELLAECGDADALCARVASEYPDVAPELVREDVLALVASLREHRLVA